LVVLLIKNATLIPKIIKLENKLKRIFKVYPSTLKFSANNNTKVIVNLINKFIQRKTYFDDYVLEEKLLVQRRSVSSTSRKKDLQLNILFSVPISMIMLSALRHSFQYTKITEIIHLNQTQKMSFDKECQIHIMIRGFSDGPFSRE
jgi:hypothetical protein